MKLFVSWSGKRSYEVAVAIRDWLPLALHSVQPFVSSKDICPGSRWQNRIAAELAIAEFGLVCVTVDNQSSAWLNFEAGALASTLDNTRVIPLAIDLDPGEITGPLSQFQAKTLDKDDFETIAGRMNQVSDSPIESRAVNLSIEKWWPDLESVIGMGSLGGGLNSSRSSRSKKAKGRKLRRA